MVEGADMKLVILLSLLGFILNSFAAESFSFGDTLFNKQWGLRNNGQAIYKNISELERVKVEGISGNDIHWGETSNIETAQKLITNLGTRIFINVYVKDF